MDWMGGNQSTRRKPMQTWGKMCKLHTEKARTAPSGDQTQDLLAVRLSCCLLDI